MLHFSCKNADINLESTTIDWLTVSTNEVPFQGRVIINGEGEYTFRVSALDNDKQGKNIDTFSIMIWQGTTIEGIEPIYEAQNVISVGNIIANEK